MGEKYDSDEKNTKGDCIMVDSKNHLYTPEDAARDRKNAEKRKVQQQFSRFSNAEATSVNNATIQSQSPALQRETKPQIGMPYDDTAGSVSTNQVIDLSIFGANYTFFTVTADVAFTFDNLPTGRFTQFVVDILVDSIGGANITFPQVSNPPVLAGNDNDRYVLEFVGVVRSDPEGLTPPVETYTFISGPFNSSGITNPGGATGGHIVKNNDDSIINSTALQLDSELSFFAVPTKVYFLELNTQYISATNADIKFGLSIPSGASYKIATSNFQGSPWTPFVTISNGQTIAFAGALSLSRQSNHYLIVEAGPVGGNVTITFAQNAAQNTITKLERGTLLRVFEGGVGGLPPQPGDTFGPLKGYMIGHEAFMSPITAFRSLGGSGGGTTQNINRVPAMGAGKFKLLRTNIYVDTSGGDGLDVTTRVNGISTGFLGISLKGIGIHDTDLENRAFVKDDLIGLTLGRTDSVGTIDFNTWLELEYSSNEFWFYGPRIFGAEGVDRFCVLIGNSVIQNPSGPEFNNRNAHQRSVGRAGTIKDFVYFGEAPAGTGTTIFSIEVNGVSVFDSPDVPVHGGFAIDRFDNVNIAVGADDLINVKMNGRNGSPLQGIFGCRFILG